MRDLPGTVLSAVDPFPAGEVEALGLDEHATGAAARVVHSSLVRLDHLDQELDDGARRVELAS